MDKIKMKQIAKRLVIILLILFVIFLIMKILNRHSLAGEKFNSSQEALKAYEEYDMAHVKNPLDYNAPYNYIDTIYIEDVGIIIYNTSGFHLNRIHFEFIKKTRDNMWKFTNGYAWLEVNLGAEEYWQDGAYNFDNIVINHKKYAVCFSYLPINSDKEIYVDGIKSEKRLITIPREEGDIDVYLCYALSNKNDNLINNIRTKIEDRHTYEIR